MNVVLMAAAWFVVFFVWFIGVITAYKSIDGGCKRGWQILWSAFSWLFFVVVVTAFIVVAITQRTYDAIDDLTDNIKSVIMGAVDWVDEVI